MTTTQDLFKSLEICVNDVNDIQSVFLQCRCKNKGKW